MAPLKVDSVYFYPRENAQTHNTVKFEAVNEREPRTTIVRRGQPFNGVIRFTRSFKEDTDVVQLVFTLGNKPSMETQGSMFIRRSDAVDEKHSWSAKLVAVQRNDQDLSFEVSTPVNLPVGSWSVRVVTRVRGSDEREIYDFDQDLYILFNPWIPDDQTYMEDTALLQEYVLSDAGKVWVGPVSTALGKPWIFGQFDAAVLPACMFMLDRVGLPFHLRGDPIKLSRAISRIVNANDDAGVLVGSWDGEYSEGTAPAEWTGSVEILQQYLETQEPVLYGQCWVFAGVVTTVCRALGIPSRVVSNFVSAHDANCTLTVDKYYTEDMGEIEGDPNNEKNESDSIWNYHVWNDVWMARPDLPAGYGGWQAIDATPQETSSGFFQCGPASLEAIKQGVIGLGYDVEFMLSSVNADLMRWRRDPLSETQYSMVSTNHYHIGRMLLTKKPYVYDAQGDNDREDITSQYKYQEGTVAERVALMKGVTYSERAKRYYEVMQRLKNDVTFKMRDIDTVKIGKEFKVTVDIENTSDEDRSIKAVLMATTVFYNGVRANMVKKVEDTTVVGPRQSIQINVRVSENDYLPKLVEYGNIRISAMAIVDETKQSWADDDDFQVLKPTISIKFTGDVILGEPAKARLSFVNPLKHPLTGCEFRLNSPGVLGRAIRFGVDDVGPEKLVLGEVPVKANKAGEITFVATFTSRELKDVTGTAKVIVLEG